MVRAKTPAAFGHCVECKLLFGWSTSTSQPRQRLMDARCSHCGAPLQRASAKVRKDTPSAREPAVFVPAELRGAGGRRKVDDRTVSRSYSMPASVHALADDLGQRYRVSASRMVRVLLEQAARDWAVAAAAIETRIDDLSVNTGHALRRVGSKPLTQDQP